MIGRVKGRRKGARGRSHAPAVERLEDRRLLAVSINEFTIPTAQSGPAGIVLGPDGNLWFTESNTGQIGTINAATHAFQEFNIGNPGSDPLQIAVGPDGKLWFTEQGNNSLAAIVANGDHTIQQVPVANPIAFPYGIATGPDGQVWFAETSRNAIDAYNLSTQTFAAEVTAVSNNAEPYNITAGPAGNPNLYFTEQIGNAIGIYNTQTHTTSEIPTPTSGSNPGAITIGPDGNLWFTEGNANKIGVLNLTTSTITEYPIPTANSVPSAITVGPDGNLWFTEAAGNKIGMITTAGQVTEYNLPSPNSQPAGIAAGPDGTLWVTEQGTNQIAVVNIGQATLPAPHLASADDTGVSNTDGITRNNGSTSAPLDFTISDVTPANGFVTLHDNGNILAGPVQAAGTTATFHLASNTPLADGSYQITYTTSPTATGAQSAPSAPLTLVIQTSLTITATNPADGSVISSLPNGQVVVTFSHPLAGLTDGQSPIQNSGTFNPYDVFLLARGPAGVFSAPSGVDAGDLPLHANVVYHLGAGGTSEFVITPTEPLSSDVYAISLNLPSFSDLAGNPLTDPKNGYRTFLLQLPPVNSQPLAVTGVTEFNGYAAINNNAVYQPDTIQIHFNKPLYAGAAGNGNAQLIANPGPNSTVVPTLAAYSPTTDSIYLTPTAALYPGTVYVIRVAGQDSGSSFVSDDQGYGNPGFPLAQTFYDSFTVLNAPASPGQGSFQVATSGDGTPNLLPIPSNNSEWGLPVGYASVQFTDALNMSSLGRFSAMLIPRSGGLNNAAFDAADVPLNATLAFNPNTNQLIIVPSQPVGNDIYLFSLSNMTAANGNPLLNNAGQPAGVGGNAPYFATFGLQAANPAVAAVAVAERGTTAMAAVAAGPPAPVTPSSTAASAAPAKGVAAAVVVVRSRPSQAVPAGILARHFLGRGD